MFGQILCKVSNESVRLRKKSITGEISKNEQIQGQILEVPKCIRNDIYKLSITSEGVQTIYSTLKSRSKHKKQE